MSNKQAPAPGTFEDDAWQTGFNRKGDITLLELHGQTYGTRGQDGDAPVIIPAKQFDGWVAAAIAMKALPKIPAPPSFPECFTDHFGTGGGPSDYTATDWAELAKFATAYSKLPDCPETFDALVRDVGMEEDDWKAIAKAALARTKAAKKVKLPKWTTYAAGLNHYRLVIVQSYNPDADGPQVVWYNDDGKLVTDIYTGDGDKPQQGDVYCGCKLVKHAMLLKAHAVSRALRRK